MQKGGFEHTLLDVQRECKHTGKLTPKLKEELINIVNKKMMDEGKYAILSIYLC